MYIQLHKCCHERTENELKVHSESKGLGQSLFQDQRLTNTAMVASIQPFVVEAFVQEFRTNTPNGQDLKDSKLKGLVHNEFDPITLRFMLEGNSLPRSHRESTQPRA